MNTRSENEYVHFITFYSYSYVIELYEYYRLRQTLHTVVFVFYNIFTQNVVTKYVLEAILEVVFQMS